MRRILLSMVVLFPFSLFAQSAHITTERGPEGRLVAVRVQPVSFQHSPNSSILDARLSADLFLQENATALELESSKLSYQFVASRPDSLGMTHIQYAQYLQGVPIYGAQFLVHTDKQNRVSFINGSFAMDDELDVSPNVSSADSITAARSLWESEFGPQAPTVTDSTLYVYDAVLAGHSKSAELRLVWSVKLFSASIANGYTYLMDAKSGELVRKIPLRENLTRVIGDCSFGDGNCYLDAFSSGLNYTFGRSEGMPERGPNPINANRNDFGGYFTWNSFGSTDVDDLYDIIGDAQNYFSEVHGRNGANGLGGMGDGTFISSFQTVALSLINWDGSQPWMNGPACPNAYFAFNQLGFCLGIVATDTVSHEFGHAVQQYSILDSGGDPVGLDYVGESGAINEGLADVFGAAVENYSSGAGNWEMGDSLPLLQSFEIVRSLSDPPSKSDFIGPYPDRFFSPNYDCDTEEVHHNSTVFSKAAYLMAEGGDFNTCHITALGREKEEKIFYRAITTYFTQTTGYNAAYAALVQACDDLYSEADCVNATKALRAVEMNQAGKCGSQAPVAPDCASLDDQCPSDDVKATPGICGCGVADVDANANGVTDCLDPVVTGVVPAAATVKSGKRKITFSMAPFTGVTYVVKLVIKLPDVDGVKKKKKTKFYSGTTADGIIKKLKTGSKVTFSYFYQLEGTPVLQSEESPKKKVKIK